MPNGLTRPLAALLAVLVTSALAAPAAATTDVAIVGDSITDRSRGAIHNAVEPAHDIVWFETQNSATIARMRPLLMDAVSGANGPDIVLVELGTGNAFWGTSPTDFRNQVRRLNAALLQRVDCVRWFEQKPGGNRAYPTINGRARQFNQIVREEVSRYVRSRTVHYEAWTRLAGNSIFVPDLLHLNEQGKRGLGALARQAVEGCDPAFTSGRFWDVQDHFWAATEINWVGDQHLIDGYQNGTYRAQVGGIAPALTRSAWAQALWRRVGRPVGYPAAPWPDAAGGPALAWAWAEDLTDLPADRPFRPTAAVTRADTIRWLYRAAGRPDASGYPEHGLVDVAPGLNTALRWAKGVGIVTTPAGGRFVPAAPLSRAGAAVFLYRWAHPAPPPSPSPAPTTTTPPTTTEPPTTTTAPPTTLAPTTTLPPTTTTAPEVVDR